jgi:hypothetical protein
MLAPPWKMQVWQRKELLRKSAQLVRKIALAQHSVARDP